MAAGELTRRAGRALAAAALLAAAGMPGAAQESPGAEPRADASAAEGSAAVRGRVVIPGTRAPLPHAVVRVAGSGPSAVADSAGRYRLAGLPPGEVTLEAVYMGTPVARGDVTLAPGQERRVNFTADRVMTEVSELRVEVEGVRRGRMAGFEKRRERGRGSFVTREEIRESGMERARQIVVREAPGARLARANRLGDRELVLRDGAHHCRPAFFVNGSRSPGFGLERIHPRHIQAMEIYDGQSAPARYNVMEGCGVVLVWTRTGGVGGG